VECGAFLGEEVSALTQAVANMRDAMDEMKAAEDDEARCRAALRAAEERSLAASRRAMEARDDLVAAALQDGAK